MKKALNLFSLAFQGVCRKRRSSILVFSVLLVSFAFSIVSLSLVGSISKTNAQFRQMNYGAWCFGIPSGKPEDAQWLKSQSWAETVGTAQNYGTVTSTSRSAVGFGTVDEALIRAGNLRLDYGRWPVADHEIALEASILNGLGYDYTLGQEITLRIWITVGTANISVQRSYTLCGVIHEYTRLWQLNQNRASRSLVGAVVTQTAAEDYREAVKEQTQNDDEIPAVNQQYYMTVAEGDRETAGEALKAYLQATRTKTWGDQRPCENTVAYPDLVERLPETVYTKIIVAVAALAVLCVYIMQLPAETKSYATLRSIGITKLQLACLLLLETLLLCIPAMVLGIPLGMGLTRLALQLLMYSGSVAIQVAVPYGMLAGVIALWIGTALLSRLVVLLVTVSTPLVGKFQMQAAKARRTKRLRSATVLLLLISFVVVWFYTGIQMIYPLHSWRWCSDHPVYIVSSKRPTPQSALEQLEDIPGITKTNGLVEGEAMLTFDDSEEALPIWLYAVDDTKFDFTKDLGEATEAFRAGSLCILLLPEDGKTYALPEESITLHVEAELPEKEEEDPEKAKTVTVDSGATPYLLLRLREGILNQGLANFLQPYTVLVSHSYLERFLTGLPEDADWDKFTGGGPYGYDRAHVFADPNAGDLSTDVIMVQMAKRLGLSVDNQREMIAASRQAAVQKLILLCAVGGGIGLVLLMILASTVSLEAEQEKKYYHTLRVIGMSRRQMRRSILGKAAGRSALAMAIGTGVWFCVIASGAGSISAGLAQIAADLRFYDGAADTAIFFLGSSCFVILLAVCLLAKGKLRKGVESV